jgi:hypothetical protein
VVDLAKGPSLGDTITSGCTPGCHESCHETPIEGYKWKYIFYPESDIRKLLNLRVLKNVEISRLFVWTTYHILSGFKAIIFLKSFLNIVRTPELAFHIRIGCRYIFLKTQNHDSMSQHAASPLVLVLVVKFAVSCCTTLPCLDCIL